MKFKVKSFICLTFDIRVFMARVLQIHLTTPFVMPLTWILLTIYDTFIKPLIRNPDIFDDTFVKPLFWYHTYLTTPLSNLWRASQRQYIWRNLCQTFHLNLRGIWRQLSNISPETHTHLTRCTFHKQMTNQRHNFAALLSHLWLESQTDLTTPLIGVQMLIKYSFDERQR